VAAALPSLQVVGGHDGDDLVRGLERRAAAFRFGADACAEVRDQGVEGELRGGALVAVRLMPLRKAVIRVLAVAGHLDALALADQGGFEFGLLLGRADAGVAAAAGDVGPPPERPLGPGLLLGRLGAVLVEPERPLHGLDQHQVGARPGCFVRQLRLRGLQVLHADPPAQGRQRVDDDARRVQRHRPCRHRGGEHREPALDLLTRQRQPRRQRCSDRDAPPRLAARDAALLHEEVDTVALAPPGGEPVVPQLRP
jgi:hypothetical protein